jgi:predicted nucleic acid-binding Zn ribbon protein
MVTPLRDILRAAVKTWGLEPVARLARLQAAWSRLVGGELAAASAPVSLRGGRLLVAVTNSTAGQEIRVRRADILRVLVRELGEEVVTDIRPVARRRLPGGQFGREKPR